MNAAPVKSSIPPGVVILGAGASSRMGQPKLLLSWQDRTIIGHLISQWQRLGAKQIAIVHRPKDELLFTELKRLDYSQTNCIENPQPELGMFSSIVCAANWNGWNSELTHFAIVLGDQPHLQLQTLRTLLEFSAQNPAKICQPACSGQTGHPVVLPRDVFDALQGTRAKTLKDFLKHFSVRSVQCVINDAGVTLDLDTPEDYKRVQATK
jgi:molybdenum cofactor cytidylyltransferase